MNGIQENQKLGSVRNANLLIGTKKKLTQKKLKELLHYEPETGVFTWTHRLLSRNRPSAFSGREAGCLSGDGYYYISVSNRLYKRSRLAWLFMYGYFPEHEVDHINRIRKDDRGINLREVSHQCNLRNCGNFKHNTSGVKGVCWDKNKNKWMSKIKINQKTIFLGYYKVFHNAVCARLAGEQCVNWEGCDSSSPSFKYVQKMLWGRQF